MMRTSRLRRWLLRGALLSAAVAPLAAGSAQADEWNWEKLPQVGTPTEQAPDAEQSYLTDLYEWNWE